MNVQEAVRLLERLKRDRRNPSEIDSAIVDAANALITAGGLHIRDSSGDSKS